MGILKRLGTLELGNIATEQSGTRGRYFLVLAFTYLSSENDVITQTLRYIDI